MGALGRRVPPDFRHLEAYPLRALLADPTHELVIPPDSERSLGLPTYWRTWDQGNLGSCVGWGCSAMMGILNTRQSRVDGQATLHRYHSLWLYNEAQKVDDWPETPPEEGTSVRAACDILRARGHVRVVRGWARPENVAEGISANRWAQSVDEIRAAIYAGLPVAIGVNWYRSFMAPYQKDGEYWIDFGQGSHVVGGHCVCLYRMSDRRQAFRVMNSWGEEWPPCWIPYEVMTRLINEQGECAVVTDY